MASRKISDLHRNLQPLCEEFVSQCKKEGITILVYCTWRSPKEQNDLYAQGRTEPGRVVTWAKGGESDHNHTDSMGHPASKAFDCVPLLSGKPAWDAEDPIWQIVGEIGESVGLEWAGRWPKEKREYPHFSLKD